MTYFRVIKAIQNLKENATMSKLSTKKNMLYLAGGPEHTFEVIFKCKFTVITVSLELALAAAIVCISMIVGIYECIKSSANYVRCQ